MLNRVRYGADRVCVRNVHWLNALAAATSIVWSAPSSSSAAKSTAYDTDIVDPLLASGRLTLNAEASDDSSSSAVNSGRFAIACGAKIARTRAPAARTAPTNNRAGVGRSFITPAGEPSARAMIQRNARSPGVFADAASGRARFGLQLIF